MKSNISEKRRGSLDLHIVLVACALGGTGIAGVLHAVDVAPAIFWNCVALYVGREVYPLGSDDGVVTVAVALTVSIVADVAVAIAIAVVVAVSVAVAVAVSVSVSVAVAVAVVGDKSGVSLCSLPHRHLYCCYYYYRY